ncbi:MAG: hypothetical protein M1834_004230 [Cirrosporium novae-zelandiae]|nr:MAG: hypothetical protein M1834_004230 [Cirrosporium novae-zelandiae]
MDIFSTTITVIHEIYAITVFIRGVVNDVSSYESDKKDIQDKLQHEFVFIDMFKITFLDEGAGRERYIKQPKILQQDVNITSMKLRSILGEYRTEAVKHGLLDPHDNAANEGRIQVHALLKQIKSTAKDLKKKGFNWSLFDKAKILHTLCAYTEWAQRLRQTMSLMLSTMFLGGDGYNSLGDFANTQVAKDMGLQNVARRQALIRSSPPGDFKELDGTVVGGSEWAKTSHLKIAKYVDGWESEPREVVLEYRKYNKILALATRFRHAAVIRQLKEPIRKLAWLLHSSTFLDGNDESPMGTANYSTLLALQCIGYLDQPDQCQTIFLYELPQATTLWGNSWITTLHDLINSVDPITKYALPKPVLGHRFFLSYALALTVLNIHSSRWVHENISSHGVVVFPAPNLSRPSGAQRLIPYLTGWESARPILGDTELRPNIEIEPNLYHHPIRQGQPTSRFTAEYDIYALGVVLMEIGLWKTMNSVFHQQIEKALHASNDDSFRSAPSVDTKVERCLDESSSVLLHKGLATRQASPMRLRSAYAWHAVTINHGEEEVGYHGTPRSRG